MPRMFKDEELASKVITIKVGAGVHAALRKLSSKLQRQHEQPSLNAVLRSALEALVLPMLDELDTETKDLWLLTSGNFPRKGSV